ncbi:MAG: hypothetical protein P8X48_10175 [Acidiferrobacteraceae bacterium]|jgi:cytochrome c553
MRPTVVLLVLLLLSGVATAGMMGSGMGGGMMGPSGSGSNTPPANLDSAARKGYDLTQEYCGRCHAAPVPQQHTAAEWPRVVDRMERYMHRQGRPAPNAEDTDTILHYLASATAR